MATRTWMLGLWLGLVGFSLATGCVVKSDDDDDDTGAAGEGGDSSGGTSTGGKGGSATGGKGGTSTGGTSTGGTSTGGTSTGGTSTGGTSTGGTMNTSPECDPDMGELMNTPYPNCTATAGNDCEACMERSCCELNRICYGYNPGNVCGWGGPDNDGEILCYIDCVATYYEENGVYDDDGKDACAAMCATTMCNLIGNATQDLVECVDTSCQADCYGIME